MCVEQQIFFFVDNQEILNVVLLHSWNIKLYVRETMSSFLTFLWLHDLVSSEEISKSDQFR